MRGPYVRKHVCVRALDSNQAPASGHVGVYVYTCVCVNMSACMYNTCIRMYEIAYACIYVCMYYVCGYVLMHVPVCMYVRIRVQVVQSGRGGRRLEIFLDKVKESRCGYGKDSGYES